LVDMRNTCEGLTMKVSAHMLPGTQTDAARRIEASPLGAKV